MKSEKNIRSRLEKSPTSEIVQITVAPCEPSGPSEKIVGDDFMTSDDDVSFDGTLKINDIEDHPFYTCEVCERKRLTKSNLLIHQRIHTDDHPCSCHMWKTVSCIERTKSPC
jgi:hypothetical protein